MEQNLLGGEACVNLSLPAHTYLCLMKTTVRRKQQQQKKASLFLCSVTWQNVLWLKCEIRTDLSLRAVETLASRTYGGQALGAASRIWLGQEAKLRVRKRSNLLDPLVPFGKPQGIENRGGSAKNL